MKAKPIHLTQEQLLEIFDYDPSTGALTWKIHRSNRAPKGSYVGWVHTTGHLRTKIDSISYFVHRIIWKMLYNEEPEEIDHDDCNKLNNAQYNLRACDSSQNAHNRFKYSNNSSGVKGLTHNKSKTSNNWLAQIRLNGKNYYRYFPFNDEGKDKATQWLTEMRAILHGEFSNNG